MKIKKQNPQSKKAVILASAIGALLIFGGGLYFYNVSRGSKSDVSSHEPPVNYSPPTKDQKQAGDRIKENSTSTDTDDRQGLPQSDISTNKTSVPVTITDASQYGDVIEVRAYVAGITETSGTCTVTLSQGSQTVTRTTQTTASASTTQCAKASIPVSDLPARGSWSVVVAYNSSTSAGQSGSMAIEVH